MSQTIKIACLGDSVVYGHGIKENREELVWTALLEDLLNGQAMAEAEEEEREDGHHHEYPQQEGLIYEVRNFGKNGQSLLVGPHVPYRQDESPLYREMIDWKPDALVLHIGGNDYASDKWDPDIFEKEFSSFADKMIELCGRKHVCLLAPGPACGEVNSIIMKEAEKRGCDAVDLDLLFAELPKIYEECPELFADPEHPNEAGNEFMADVLYSIIGAWEF